MAEKKRPRAKEKGLSAFTLRIIAFITMTIGCAQVLVTDSPVDWKTYMFYFSYTIFAFLLVEGIKHSQNRWAYLRRLIVFAAISEVPGDLLFSGVAWDTSRQSVMLTLLIAFIVINIVDFIRDRLNNMVITLVALVVLCFLGTLACRYLHCELADFGLIIAGILYLCSNVTYTKVLQLICFGAIVLYVTADNYFNIMVDDLYYSVPDKTFALAAVILTWFYNGKRGPNTLAWKIVFYAFFPVMLLVIYLIKTYLIA